MKNKEQRSPGAGPDVLQQWNDWVRDQLSKAVQAKGSDLTASAWLGVIDQVRNGADELYGVIGKYSKSKEAAPDEIHDLKKRLAALEQKVSTLAKPDPSEGD